MLEHNYIAYRDKLVNHFRKLVGGDAEGTSYRKPL